jgi:hypothetical protein
MGDLTQMSEIELLQTHSKIIDELRRRGVVTTRNNPVGDYTEWLVCRAMGLMKKGNSQAGFDAVDKNGVRYQIKGRQDEGNSVQFSAIRNLDRRDFEVVIAVVFDNVFSVRLAVMIPHAMVPEFARYYEHTNAHNLILTEKAIGQAGVTDISNALNQASSQKMAQIADPPAPDTPAIGYEPLKIHPPQNPQSKWERFAGYLREVGKIQDTAVRTRVSNCKRMEQFEGDLDDHFDADQCQKLLARLTYSTRDQELNIRPRHNIPINGDLRNGSATLKQAVTLYVRYRRHAGS